MAVSRCASCCGGGSMLLQLFWILIPVYPSLPQPPLPLSLPVHMSLLPPPWHFLPVSQAEQNFLFSNSSPFSFSQSLFLLRPGGQTPRPRLHASFGPYSVTKVISDSAPPAAPPLAASPLSEHVDRDRDEMGRDSFRVSVLFHRRGNTITEETCITLHAFQETEEIRASCITQAPLGQCVVTLTLPNRWFHQQHTNQTHHALQDRRRSNTHPRWRGQKRTRQRGKQALGYRDNQQQTSSPSARTSENPDVDGRVHVDGSRAHRHQWNPKRSQIQLYYSSVDAAAVQLPRAADEEERCVEDKLPQSQRRLFHIKAVTLKDEEEEEEAQKKDGEDKGVLEEKETCLTELEEEELTLDPHVLIRYHRGPVMIGQPIRVSVNMRANFSDELVIIRLKVKKGLVSMVAQRTLTSDLWAVTLDRSQGSRHDVVTIHCLKHSTASRTHTHTHSPTLLQQVVCLSVHGLRRSFGVAMTVSADWWVEYSGPTATGRAACSFSFTDRHISGIAPVTESNIIINTAILTSQPVSLPVTVLAISGKGKLSDVTSAVLCHSANEDIVKVSPDCATVFVDGSESGLGNTCAEVRFLLGKLSASVCLEVWAPSVPLRVSVADPVLNAIDGWSHVTEEECVPVYQRSSIQVLTQFRAQDARSRTTYLLGSSEWFVDVTPLVRNWLRVEDPRVASIGPQNDMIGLRPGRTSLHVVSEQWDGVLGSCNVTVTSDTVTPGDLSVQVVSGLGMSVTGSSTHPSIVRTTVTAYNILYNLHQEASISIWLQFSDDTASLLSTFSDVPFVLHLSSLAESVVMVTPGVSHRIFARGDGGGPLLCAELMVSSCSEQPIISSSMGGVNREGGGGGGGGTKRLAKGSGWIRVNLDMDLPPPAGNKEEEEDEFEFELLDVLVDSDSDTAGMESHSSERDGSGPSSEFGNGMMANGNNLEKAVLIPNQEEAAIYFSPKLRREGDRDEDQGQSAPELEVGLGTILSLLGLSTILFLANCLPCALQSGEGGKMARCQEGGEGGGASEEEGEDTQRTKEAAEELHNYGQDVSVEMKR